MSNANMDSTRYLAEKSEADRVVVEVVFTRETNPDEYWANRVADCESGARLGNGSAVAGSYRLRAKNPHSTASGKYQFLDGTWEWVTGLPAPARAYPERVQDEAFYKLWDGGKGSFHWNPSRSCWKG